MFSESPSIFVLFDCNLGALNLRLNVVVLPASLAMSWPAEITQKLNRSGLDFLVLVLQSSNSFNLNAFFNFASVYFLLLAWVQVQFLPFGSRGSTFCSPCQDWKFSFFWSEIFKQFFREIHFRKVLHF